MTGQHGFAAILILPHRMLRPLCRPVSKLLLDRPAGPQDLAATMCTTPHPAAAAPPGTPAAPCRQVRTRSRVAVHHFRVHAAARPPNCTPGSQAPAPTASAAWPQPKVVHRAPCCCRTSRYSSSPVSTSQNRCTFHSVHAEPMLPSAV